MARLFIAIDVPDPARDRLVQLRGALKGARWTAPVKYHITLRFVGEVSDERVAALCSTLEAVPTEPMPDLRATGLAVFPSRSHPRVLAAILERARPLITLQRRIEEAVQALGFDAEERSFRPHVTLARLKKARPREVVAYMRAHQELDVSFSVSAFHLYESELRSSGAVHQRRAMFSISG